MTPSEAAKGLPYLRRRYLVAGGMFVGGMGLWAAGVAAVTLFNWSSASSGGTRWGILFMRFSFVPPIVMAVVVGVVVSIWNRRLLSSVRRTSGALCPACCYELSAPAGVDSGAASRCPECGCEVFLDDVKARWRAWAG